MGIGYCNRCKRYDGHDTNCPTVVGEPGEQQLRSRIEQLTARVRELEEENARLRFALADTEALELGTSERLAASQAYAKQLRVALETLNKVSNIGCSLVDDALALPRNTSALDAYVEQKVKEAMK